MKRHRFTKWNKEKISVYASAGLIICVCVVSGMYAQSQSPSKTQILDIEPVQPKEADAGTDMSGVGDKSLAQTETPEEEAQAVSAKSDSVRPGGMPSSVGEASGAEDLTGDAEVSDSGEKGDLAVMAEGKRAEPEPLHFNADDGILWPVMGNVIMNYSMDERIYFATLNQYCYYPAVAISAGEGDPVSAAAKGSVAKIGVNEEIGQYLILDLGDGYQATYGQLADITVETGDTVSKGQVLGYVAPPTKYYSIEGTNIYFKLEQDGVSVDPVVYFR